MEQRPHYLITQQNISFAHLLLLLVKLGVVKHLGYATLEELEANVSWFAHLQSTTGIETLHL
jgi:hypothetical protein